MIRNIFGLVLVVLTSGVAVLACSPSSITEQTEKPSETKTTETSLTREEII